MVVNKRKKYSRQRASHTHGWGSKKKHRGAGSRGGKGFSGSGKRGDAKKTKYWKDTKYFGKYGFKPQRVKEEIIAINLYNIEEKVEAWLNDKQISKEGSAYVIDLEKIGSNKLLGNGQVKNKLKISVKYASNNAIEKVKKAGGEVSLKSGKKATSSK